MEDLKKAITPKAKGLIINSPSNPTGSAYTKKELEKIAEIGISRNFFVISDEIYEKIVYDGFEFISIASLGEEIKKRTIIVHGVAKTYAMTGWRIGYTAGPEEIVCCYEQYPEPEYLQPYLYCSEGFCGGSHRSSGRSKKDGLCLC